jgi:hypothetical protein
MGLSAANETRAKVNFSPFAKLRRTVPVSVGISDSLNCCQLKGRMGSIISGSRVSVRSWRPVQE